jgi:hypothetical protein
VHDIKCFVNAAKQGETAKVSYIIINNSSSVKQNTTVVEEIERNEPGNAVVYTMIEKVVLAFPENIPQETAKAESERFKQIFEGKSMRCTFNDRADFILMVEGIESPTGGNPWEANCTGELADVMGMQ